MGQKKLKRFAEIATFRNVLEHPQGMKGAWAAHFGNKHPITLELACGKGEYTVGLGSLYPERNFIGIDLKGNRIWVGAKRALEVKLDNVAFLRAQIDQLADYFEADEVSEIWITFPDPQLRLSRAKKRLTHPKFLRIYQKILQSGGLIHLKTDSPDLYQFTKKVAALYDLKVCADYDDVHSTADVSEELRIKTHYENLDIASSNRIHYLSFSLPKNLPGIFMDEKLKELIKTTDEEVI